MSWIRMWYWPWPWRSSYLRPWWGIVYLVLSDEVMLSTQDRCGSLLLYLVRTSHPHCVAERRFLSKFLFVNCDKMNGFILVMSFTYLYTNNKEERCFSPNCEPGLIWTELVVLSACGRSCSGVWIVVLLQSFTFIFCFYTIDECIVSMIFRPLL